MKTFPTADKYFKDLERRRLESSRLVIRRKKKTTRLFVDREYFSRGYAAVLRPPTFTVYGVLAAYAHSQKQTCYPSIPTIMREGGVKNRNTVLRCIKNLERLHVIEVDRSKGRHSNFYTLIDPQFWKPINSINIDTVGKKKVQPPNLPNAPP